MKEGDGLQSQAAICLLCGMLAQDGHAACDECQDALALKAPDEQRRED